ncbi:MAG: hypothetical protein P0S93_05460, partial [Candidatus Neptunochlamydia sp.]|nr:hypothetical protein [Candidatus Neptunochlamydia sp.]
LKKIYINGVDEGLAEKLGVDIGWKPSSAVFNKIFSRVRPSSLDIRDIYAKGQAKREKQLDAIESRGNSFLQTLIHEKPELGKIYKNLPPEIQADITARELMYLANDRSNRERKNRLRESEKMLADLVFGKGAPSRKEIEDEVYNGWKRREDREYQRSNHDLGMSGHGAGSSSYAENKASLEGRTDNDKNEEVSRRYNDALRRYEANRAAYGDVDRKLRDIDSLFDPMASRTRRDRKDQANARMIAGDKTMQENISLADRIAASRGGEIQEMAGLEND